MNKHGNRHAPRFGRASSKTCRKHRRGQSRLTVTAAVLAKAIMVYGPQVARS